MRKAKFPLLSTLAMGLCVSAQASPADSPLKAEKATPAVQPSGVPAKEFEDGESPEDRLKFELLVLQDENHHYDPQQKVHAYEQRKELLRAGANATTWPHLAAQQQSSTTTRDTASSGLAPGVASSIQSTGWKALGPGNIGGRTRSILIHPTIPGIMWLGSVGGGVWKTTNGGQTWAPLDDFMGSIAIGCMALDPANPNILYAGTGEGFYNFDGMQGAGVFKSTDGGTTWAQLVSTATTDWYFVNRITVNPRDSRKLIAATNSGLWYSADAGVTWSQRTTIRTTFAQNDPTDGTKAVASGGSASAWYSTDGGFSWSAATGLGAGDRTELAYAPSNPSIVYAVVDNLGGQVYKSIDGGRTYALQNPSGGAGLGQQGWYDECIWVDPTNSNHIIVGGQSQGSSFDGGVTYFYQLLTEHTDWHTIISAPGFNGTSNQSIFIGCDGGIYRADSVESVSSTTTSLNNSLAITQGDGLAGSRQSSFVAMGTQDNGTLLYSGSTNWSMPAGGDGGDCSADPTKDPVTTYTSFYGEFQQGGGPFRISVDSTGYVPGVASFGAKPIDANFNWIAPLVLDTNATQRIYQGGSDLLRIDNPRTADYTSNWIVAAAATNLNDIVSTIAVANGNSDIVWLGLNGGGIMRSRNATAAVPTWTKVDQGVLPPRFCTKVTISPTDPNVVYATFGGFSIDNVWVTTNGGGSWTSIHHNLPAAPVHGVAIDPANTSHIYVGTEVGVFGSDDNGTTWSTTNDGPANVAVWDIKMMGTKLLISTHGRGAFWYDLASVPAAPTGLVATGGNSQVKLTWTSTPGASSYSVKRATVSGGPYSTVATGITVATYTNTGLVNGTRYYFVVSASNAVGQGANSAEVNATPKIPVPAAPTGLVATAGNAQVKLAWTASAGASSYTVKRGAAAGGPYTTVASAITAVSYTNTHLTNTVKYFFVVSATNASGQGPNSTDASATPMATVPAAPTGVTAAAGDAQVKLAWAGTVGATSYTVKRSTVAGGPYATVATAITETTYTNTGLANGTRYYFVVSATDAIGSGANSAPVSAIPVAPSGVKVQYKVGDASATGNQIKPLLTLVNTGTASVPLGELKIRYWYTIDGVVPQNFWCDYAAVGNANVTGAFTKLAIPRPGADYYLEIGFAATAGSIVAGGNSGEIQTRFAKSDWSNYTQTGDYSFDPTKIAYADWSKITLYRNGTLVWGTEP